MAQASATKEANAVSTVFWLARGLPQPEARRTQELARSYARAQRVVEPTVTLVLAQVGGARPYLPPPSRVGPTVTPVVEEHLSPVVGLDDALEVGQECPIAAAARVVGAPEKPG